VRPNTLCARGGDQLFPIPDGRPRGQGQRFSLDKKRHYVNICAPSSWKTGVFRPIPSRSRRRASSPTGSRLRATRRRPRLVSAEILRSSPLNSYVSVAFLCLRGFASLGFGRNTPVFSAELLRISRIFPPLRLCGSPSASLGFGRNTRLLSGQAGLPSKSRRACGRDSCMNASPARIVTLAVASDR
jgi:hypothetical protein